MTGLNNNTTAGIIWQNVASVVKDIQLKRRESIARFNAKARACVFCGHTMRMGDDETVYVCWHLMEFIKSHVPKSETLSSWSDLAGLKIVEEAMP
jgi:hypothetical protein